MQKHFDNLDYLKESAAAGDFADADERLETADAEQDDMELIDLAAQNARDVCVGKQKDGIAAEKKINNIVKEIFSFLLSFAAAVAIALLIQRFVIINANIPSGSMENTIMTSDRLIGNRLSYLFGKPQRGDIVIFRYPDDESQLFVKRVIGLPGETVTIEEAKVYINGERLDEPYLKETWVVDAGPYSFEVPVGCYLVLGDNRNNSKDARYWVNSYVKEEQMLGKAVFRYWPFDTIGVLK